MRHRRAEKEDISRLIGIRKKQLIDEGSDPCVNMDRELMQFFEEKMESGQMIEWVMEEDGTIIGTSAVIFYEFPPSFTNPSGKRAYIANIYTAPAYRGRGIGTTMLDIAVSEAKDRGIHDIWLIASKWGKPVYERYGFVVADENMKL